MRPRFRVFDPAGLGRAARAKKEAHAMDIIVLGIGILFFVLSFAYIKACDSL
jgi:hypothetical protein